MTFNKLDQEIIALYDSNLKDVFSINQISKKLNKKYPYINKKVTDLLNLKVLKKIEIGRSYLCSLNLDQERTILFLTFNELSKKERLYRKRPKIKKIEEMIRSSSEAVISFAVYAGDRIIVVVENESGKKIFKASQLKSQVKLSFMNKQAFFSALLDNTDGLFTNHTVIYGYERFFEMISGDNERLNLKYNPFFGIR